MEKMTYLLILCLYYYYLQGSGAEKHISKIKYIKTSFFTGGFFWIFPVLYSPLLHLPPLRFHCVGGCWDRNQDSSDFGIAWLSYALTTRLDPLRYDTLE
jgi:hypothetical protein